MSELKYRQTTKIVNYHVLEKCSFSDLNKEVKDWIGQGWQPYGVVGLSLNSRSQTSIDHSYYAHTYVQTMVIYEQILVTDRVYIDKNALIEFLESYGNES